jgi:hypothetical protein
MQSLQWKGVQLGLLAAKEIETLAFGTNEERLWKVREKVRSLDNE